MNPSVFNHNPRTGILIVLIVVVAALSSISAAGEIVAIINSDTITTATLEKELVRIHSSNQEEMPTHGFSVERLVNKLINDRLLSQEARAIGLDHDSAVVKRITDYRENLAMRTFVSDVVPDTFTAGDEEIRARFAEDFRMFDLQIISVVDSVRAVKIADSIRSGISMDSLANRNSVDAYAFKGGVVGKRSLASAPPQAEPFLRAGRTGDIFGPIYMWRLRTVFRINGIEEADFAGLDSVRAVIQKRIAFRKRNDAIRTLADHLTAQYTVIVDSNRVNTILDELSKGIPSPDDPVLLVQGHAFLPATELRREYQFQIAERPEQDSRAVLYDALTGELQKALFLTAALEKAYDRDPRLTEQTTNYEDSLLTGRYLTEIVENQVSLPDSAISAYYRNNSNQFRLPDRIQYATLTRKTEAEALSDYNALQAGTNFDWLVSRNSVDELRDNGGVAEWTSLPMLPEHLRPAIDTMKVGQFLPPEPSAFGYAIVRLVDRREGDIQPLAEVEGRIQGMLMQQARYQAIDETIRTLREGARIEIREDILKTMTVTGKNE